MSVTVESSVRFHMSRYSPAAVPVRGQVGISFLAGGLHAGAGDGQVPVLVDVVRVDVQRPLRVDLDLSRARPWGEAGQELVEHVGGEVGLEVCRDAPCVLGVESVDGDLAGLPA